MVLGWHSTRDYRQVKIRAPSKDIRVPFSRFTNTRIAADSYGFSRTDRRQRMVAGDQNLLSVSSLSDRNRCCNLKHLKYAAILVIVIPQPLHPANSVSRTHQLWCNVTSSIG